MLAFNEIVPIWVHMCPFMNIRKEFRIDYRAIATSKVYKALILIFPSLLALSLHVFYLTIRNLNIRVRSD